MGRWLSWLCYSNGLDVLLQATTAGVTPTPGVVTVSPDGDKNEWGRIDKIYSIQDTHWQEFPALMVKPDSAISLFVGWCNQIIIYLWGMRLWN